MMFRKILAYIDLFYRWLVYDCDWRGIMEKDTQLRINVVCASCLFGGFIMMLKWCGVGRTGARLILVALLPLSLLVWLFARRLDEKSVVVWCLKNGAFWAAIMSAFFLLCLLRANVQSNAHDVNSHHDVHSVSHS